MTSLGANGGERRAETRNETRPAERETRHEREARDGEKKRRAR